MLVILNGVMYRDIIMAVKDDDINVYISECGAKPELEGAFVTVFGLLSSYAPSYILALLPPYLSDDEKCLRGLRYDLDLTIKICGREVDGQIRKVRCFSYNGGCGCLRTA